MKRVISFTIGVFLGGILGSLLILLYTPSSGTEIRGRVSSYATEKIGEIKNAAIERRQELMAELESLKS